MKYLLNHAHLIVDNCHEYIDGALLIEDEYIKDVYPQSSKVKSIEDCEVIDLSGLLIMPGFFDTHTHGINGISFDDCDEKQLDDIDEEVEISKTKFNHKRRFS